MSKIINLPLTGAKNIRDLGGITNRNGQTIRRNLFFRGDHLSGLTESDTAVLREQCHIRTVIDLRTDLEKGEREDIRIPGVNYLHLPVFDEQTAGITHERDARILASSLPDMRHLYIRMVTDESCIASLREIFSVIMEEQNHAVLYHCTEGKDRTGIVSLILLSILDVPFESIMEDYLYTNTVNEAKAAAVQQLVLQKTQDPAFAETVKNLLLARQSYLEGAISSIQERYGDMDHFLSDVLNIPESRRMSFKQSVLE